MYTPTPHSIRRAGYIRNWLQWAYDQELRKFKKGQGPMPDYRIYCAEGWMIDPVDGKMKSPAYWKAILRNNTDTTTMANFLQTPAATSDFTENEHLSESKIAILVTIKFFELNLSVISVESMEGKTLAMQFRIGKIHRGISFHKHDK